MTEPVTMGLALPWHVFQDQSSNAESSICAQTQEARPQLRYLPSQHGHLEMFYVVIYKTDKRDIANTNDSHLFFVHKLFEFSHDHFNIRLIVFQFCEDLSIHFSILLPTS